MFWIPSRSHLFAFSSLFSCAHAFDFVVSSPTECGSQRFTWVGGTPPFYAIAIIPGGTSRNVSIPANAWNEKDQSGDFSTVLPLARDKSVVFSMGDATGQTAGGISNVMTVGAPTAGAQSCNTTDPGPQFFFATDGTLQKCKNYPFTLFDTTSAVLPIAVLVMIPHGESFLIHQPNNNVPFNWQANLTAGTPVLFTMTDAQNRVGGTSPLRTVQDSDDSSCLHSVPSSAAPTRTPSPTGSAPATSTGDSGDKNNGRNKSSATGIIIGASVGGAVALIIVIALVFFFSKRNSGNPRQKPKRIDLTDPGPDSSTYLLPPGHPQAAQYPPSTTFPSYRDSIASVTPFQATPSGIPPTTMYNNNFPANQAALMDGTMGAAMTAGIYEARAVAGATSSAHSQSYQPEPLMSAKQREAVLAQQQQQQEYFNPYKPGGTSPVASGSAYYPVSSSRQTAQSDLQSQLGVGSSSNFTSTVGPNTVSSGQSWKSKQLSSPTTQPPQRFVVHTDIEDEPIELPPMYSESRAPITGMPPSNAPR